MSKGSPVIKCRVKPLIYNAIIAELQHRKDDPCGILTTMSELIEYAVIELINKRARRRRSYLKAKERRKREKAFERQSAAIYADMVRELECYQ